MKHKILNLLFSLNLLVIFAAQAQDAAPGYVVVKPDGTVLMAALVTGTDTMLYCQLREIEISAPKTFANTEEYKRYEKYQRYAPTVINYAVEAVNTYRQLEAATRDATKKDRKKVIAELEDKLDGKFRSQLKNLTRTQGYLLIKMIERELHMPFYDLIKDVKGGWSAITYNEFGKIYDYHLKEGYERGKDPLLDSILDKYDMSYYLVGK
jgi:Domain of unknown function (DUF4294)